MTQNNKNIGDMSINEIISSTGSSLSHAGDAVLDFNLRDLSGVAGSISDACTSLGNTIGGWLMSEQKTEQTVAPVHTPVPQRQLMPDAIGMSKLSQSERSRLMRAKYGMPEPKCKL